MLTIEDKSSSAAICYVTRSCLFSRRWFACDPCIRVDL